MPASQGLGLLPPLHLLCLHVLRRTLPCHATCQAAMPDLLHQHMPRHAGCYNICPTPADATLQRGSSPLQGASLTSVRSRLVKMGL